MSASRRTCRDRVPGLGNPVHSEGKNLCGKIRHHLSQELFETVLAKADDVSIAVVGYVSDQTDNAWTGPTLEYSGSGTASTGL